MPAAVTVGGDTGTDDAYSSGCRAFREGRLEDAAGYLETALADPGRRAGASNLLGLVYHRQARYGRALNHLQEAVRLRPDNAVYHSNLGLVLMETGRMDQAEAAFEAALERNPHLAEARTNLGIAKKRRNRLTEAEAAYRKALEDDPDCVRTYTNLGVTLLSQGRPEAALEAFATCLKRRPADAGTHSNLLLCMHYPADVSREAIFAESRRWAAAHGRFAQLAARPRSVGTAERIRVGYVSPDLRSHSVSFFLAPLLEAHDRSAVAVYLYADVTRPDRTTARLKALADVWRSSVGWSDHRLAETIRSDGIDVLVDLAGHTANNRLGAFARKPAPVQVSWLGYPNTTGLEQMDARLTDAVADPPGPADRLHTERLIRLEGGFLLYEPPDAPPVAPPPLAAGRGPTFGSFNNVAKQTKQGVKVWARLLAAVPSSRLILKHRSFGDAGTRKRYRRRFADEGVAPERVTLMPGVRTIREHLEIYRQVDVALDPFPYNGTTTTCEALWMGVPVVTLAGDRHASRVGASILTRVGLPDLIAHTPTDYIGRAKGLAEDPDRLADLRTGLRDRMRASPLMDGTAFAGGVEAVFRQLLSAVNADRPAAAAAPPLAPGEAETLERGLSHHRAGDLEGAERIYRGLLQRSPGHPDALHLLGVTAHQRHDTDEAVALLRQAIARRPDHPAYHANLGLANHRRARFRAAEANARKALALAPGFVNARLNLGNALRSQGRIGEAVAEYRQVLSASPDLPEVHANLGFAMRELGRVDEALRFFERARDLDPKNPRYATHVISTLGYSAEACQQRIFEESRRWAETHAVRPAPAPHPNPPHPDRRLRVGYVSPDFCGHPVSAFFEPLLANHDRSAVEVFLYADELRPDETTRRLREKADCWRSVTGWPDARVADAVRGDRIDILVDLAGHTAHHRLGVFAETPAPVQVTWLGYPNTTGMSQIHARLTDGEADPEGEADRLHAERLVRLPDGFLCFAPPLNAPAPALPPSRSTGRVTFGSFNYLAKLSDPVVETWAKLLKRMPRARLLIKQNALSEEMARKALRDRFAESGVVGDRLTLMEGQPDHRDHLAVYNRVDVALDPFPYNGTTTTCEALWMGVPVVTLAGDRHASRVGASLLTRVGLTELIANTPADYIARAEALAADPDRLTDFRRSLRDRMGRSPLTDDRGFARRMEAVHRQLWRGWCASQGAVVRKPAEGPLVQGFDRLRAGDWEAAFTEAETILKTDPADPDALHLAGSAACRMGRYEPAVALYRRYLGIRPDSPGGHLNLGVALSGAGQPAEAEGHFRRALALKPNLAAAHTGLGTALRMLKRHDEAVDAFRGALDIQPEGVGILVHLGAALRDAGRDSEAIDVHRRAISLAPDHAEAHYSLGNLLKRNGRLTEALAAYQAAIEARPDYTEAMNNMAVVLKSQGRMGEATDIYRRALTIRPDYHRAHSNLIFCMNYASDVDGAAIHGESRRWDRTHAVPLKARIRAHPNRPDPHRRLRIGYLSPDFYTHSVSYFFEPLLAAHDRSAVSLTCYADVARPDRTTDRLRELADGFRTIIDWTDTEVAERIRADAIDILVDLAGHTSRHRLLVFAQRPAPVQATWLGYPNTTGLSTIDYRLTDGVADPPGEADRLHSEILIRLEPGFLCYGPPADAPAVAPPPAGKRGTVTFGSFNNLSKLSDATVDLWARLLERVPESRLLLKQSALGDPGTRERVAARFEGAGVGGDRLELAPGTPVRADHLGRYGEVDIALDPFPYNGTTTTCEALWMGVPVVTLAGDRHAGRVGASLLTRVGLDPLIAPTPEAYLTTAAGLAADPERTARLRREIRERMRRSSLCDAEGFARSVERAFREMWRRWCAERPDASAVSSG